MNSNPFVKRMLTVAMATVLTFTTTACGNKDGDPEYSARIEDVNHKSNSTVQIYTSTPIVPDAVEWEDSSLGRLVDYVKSVDSDLHFQFSCFSTEDADVTYDEACSMRIRENMGDNILQVNSDVMVNMGREGALMDLSDVEGIDHLLPAIKSAVTMNGEMVAFPWEYVAYGLIVNHDVLKAHGLETPETIEEFLACCEKLKADGMEIPMAANKWWLECFVLTQGFADFYQSDNTDELISDLNSGATKMSEYMRPGFEFLKTCIDKGYIDVQQAASYEAFEERDAYLAQESAFMISFTGAVTGEGRKLNSYDFDLRVVGFPTENGQVGLINLSGLVVPAGCKNPETTKRAVGILCSVEGQKVFCEKQGSLPTRDDVTTTVTSMPVLQGLMDDINADRVVSVVNSSMNMELWSNTCIVVQDLLNGASVEECMAAIDEMQAEANARQN